MKRTVSIHRLVPAALRCAALLLGVGMAASANAAAVSNTASVTVGSRTIPSNTVTFSSVPAPTPATVRFFQYAPARSGATPTPADGTQCLTSGTYSAAPAVTDARGAAIASPSPALVETTRYHAREPVYLTLADANRNTDPTVREYVEVLINTDSGDSEPLRLQETGADTGLFAGAIQSVPMPPTTGAPALAANNCQLSARQNTALTVDYVDAFYPGDTAEANVLVDPFGIVFDSVSGAPVDGATVTLIDLATGLPATVFCDDGVTACPGTVTSGAPSPSNPGGTPAGGYRFPFVEAGDYRLDVTPPGGFTAPSAQTPALLAANPATAGFVIDATGSYGQAFEVPVGPALQIDLPVDAAAAGGLLLNKSASGLEVSAGDHVQYRLAITNQTAAVAGAVTVSDVLPPGLRYEPGSLRVEGAAAADPAIGPDGRTLTIPVGAIAAGDTVQVTYVTRIGTGAREGRARNVAQASAGGGLTSNRAVAEIRIKAPFMGDRQVLIGRVVDGACHAPQDKLAGVPNVKVMLENGTYVTTDKDGLFHFEGVKKGTHVVQLDLATIPADMEVLPCIRNSRFAGRSYSQFVDLPGFGIWRTDFYLRRKPPVSAPVGVQLNLERLQAGTPPPPDELYTLEANFQTLSADLTPAITAEVDALVEKLRGQKIRRISVTGHTDDARIHPAAHPVFKNNQMLSEARAQVMASLLRERLQLPLEIWDVSGAGETQPLLPNDSPDNLRRNRRVEVRLWRELEASAGTFDVSAVVDGGAVAVSNLRLTLLLPEGVTPVPGSFAIDGQPVPDPRLDGTIVTAELGSSNGAFQRVLSLRAQADAGSAAACTVAGAPVIAKAALSYSSELQPAGQVPAVQVVLACDEARATGRSTSVRNEALAVASAPASAAVVRQQHQRRAVPDEKRAAGYGIDWLEGATPEPALLFPAENYNPRAPATRVAVRHAPGDQVKLFRDGEPVSGLNFDGTTRNAAGTVAVSEWTAVDLHEGRTVLRAEVWSPAGVKVASFERTVRWGASPVSAQLVVEESLLAADGVRRPVLAVRFLDAEGRPVRYGLKGEVRINSPYVSAQYEDWTRTRALAGLDQFKPFWSVATDDGVAYIELEPTTQAGEVVLDFTFSDGRRERQQQLRSWLTAEDREWVVVGFAEGTVGYDHLKGNLQSLPSDRARDGRDETGVYTDGQVSFYAKGRVKGDWLMTIAYDTARNRGDGRLGSLHGIIDPDQFYTLYGDGSQQRYDAASQEKLYLKLERPQFYAMFGDFETGLATTVMSRYSRGLTGVKSEYDNGLFQYTAYAADTGQGRGRDELPGNGTSGLYRLSRQDLVINSETVRIETRDRFRSEKIVKTESLVRHIDYDIDYARGTLFFRRPVPNRDFAFNPVFIVAEYETLSLGDERLNAGGRVDVKLLDGAVQAGVSAIRDEDFASRGTLGGVDLKLKPTAQTEIRLEGAASETETGALTRDGGAHLAELEHHGDRLDVLAYTRRQDSGFGVGQQNLSEAGMQKTGVDGRYALTERVSLEGQAFRQENLVSEVTRDVAGTGVRYQDASTGATLGVQTAVDADASGREQRSDQVAAGVSQKFLGGKLELEARSELNVDDAENLDYPDRYALQAGYQVTPGVKLIAAHEITRGEFLDTNTSRVGAQLQPWSGSTLDSTLNQQINEYGPRTFGVLGLTQAILLDARWALDFTLDRSHTFIDESAPAPIVLNPAQPLASGTLSGDDFTAATAGLTYRADVWSWNGRTEWRDGEQDDRWGVSSGFLREARQGVAFSALGRGFHTETDTASSLATTLSLSWAWRPLGARYSILDRLELSYGRVRSGGAIGSAAEASVQNLESRKLINNFALNRVSHEWTEEDRSGNLFTAQQRNQWTLYYGSKYAWETFDAGSFRGYTDLLGAEVRHDLTHRWDVGAQASVLHTWAGKDVSYSAGPNIGYTPIPNFWVSLGFNLTGFRDRDFDAANYTAEGLYLKLRIKFDQNTRLREPHKPAQVLDWNDDMSDEPRRLP